MDQDVKMDSFSNSDSSCFGIDEAVPPPAKKAKVVQTSGAPQLIFSVCPLPQKARSARRRFFRAQIISDPIHQVFPFFP